MEISGLIKKFRSAEKRLVLLDYDGTLVNFETTPEAAAPGERLLKILQKLCLKPGTKVAVISGRPKKSIDSFIGHLPLNIVAEHGAVMKINGTWIETTDSDMSWKKEILALLEKYCNVCNFSFIEEKHFSVCWHYRMVEEKTGWETSRKLILELAAKPHNFKVMDGNKVVEILVKNADKGTAALEMVGMGKYDFVLALGDDKTDEDMFGALAALENCHTVKVGSGSTLAKHKLVNVPEVLLFLEQLSV
jgi:trehalose 6-phosphate synthase/phosphatase